jgi:hypothetical protein
MVALTAKKKLPFNFVVLSDVVPWHILEHASIIPPFIDIPPIVEFVWTQSTPTSTNLSFYHLDCHLKGMPYPHNIHLKSTILLVIFHNFRVSFQLLFLTIFLKPRMVKSCEIPFQTREITINHIYLLENYYFLVIFLVQMVEICWNHVTSHYHIYDISINPWYLLVIPLFLVLFQWLIHDIFAKSTILLVKSLFPVISCDIPLSNAWNPHTSLVKHGKTM